MDEPTLTVGLHSGGRQRRRLGKHTLRNSALDTECGKKESWDGSWDGWGHTGLLDGVGTEEWDFPMPAPH